MKRLLANLLDIRVVIGGLFFVYGVILTLVGLFDRAEVEAQAQGVDINLWVGLAMLAFGLVFLVWVYFNPLKPVEEVRAEIADDDVG